MLRLAGLLLLAIVPGACRATAVEQAPALVEPVPLFGPVIGAEVIGGRVQNDKDVAEEITLLAGGVDLVRIDLGRRRFVRVHLQLGPGDSCWGLARLSSGALWTLKGRRTLARVAPDGRIDQEVPLSSPLFGIFAAGDRLVYQEATFTLPSPALTMASDGTRAPWSGITTRPFDRLARASAAALNLLSCGATLASERACWFPDEAAVFLVDEAGHTRRVALEGLTVVPPETLLTSDNPPRPVRDAYVAGATELWVLSSGTAPPGLAGTPGGWVLARYAGGGAPQGQSHLSEAARLILHVDPDRVTLLLSSGKVGEVRKW
jgi:hypothetical protein